MGRGAGAHLAPLLRRAAAGRREFEGYGGARASLLCAGNPAACAARRARADFGAWQLAARANHGAGAVDAGADFKARAWHWRADRLPAQCGLDRRVAARSRGMTVIPEAAQ